MRTSTIFVVALFAACGPTDRESPQDLDGGGPADAASDAQTACVSLGSGWVALGDGPLTAPDGVAHGAIVGDPIPTISYTTFTQGDTDVGRAIVAEARGGAWHQLGAPLAAPGPSLQGRFAGGLAHAATGTWLVTYEARSQTDFGMYNYLDVAMRLARWDGSRWHEVPETLNDLAAVPGVSFAQLPALMVTAPDGRLLVGMREFINTPVADGPWQTRVRIASYDDGVVHRSVATLAGWETDLVSRNLIGLFTGATRDVLVVAELWAGGLATVFFDEGAGWAPASTPLSTDDGIVAALFTNEERLVIVTATGEAWSGDGTAPWRSIAGLPFGGLLSSVRTITNSRGDSFIAWVSWAPGTTDLTLRIARLDGETWVPLEVGLPPALQGMAWGADLSIDDCGRPLVLATTSRGVEAWRFDGAGTPIP